MLFLEYDLEWSFFVFNFQSFFYDDTLRIVILLIYNSLLCGNICTCDLVPLSVFGDFQSINLFKLCLHHVASPIPFEDSNYTYKRPFHSIPYVSYAPSVFCKLTFVCISVCTFFLTCPLIPSSIVSNRIQTILYS